ncbi:MAG: hypothetical protein P8080_03540 [Gammaproteobacteria bacterium]
MFRHASAALFLGAAGLAAHAASPPEAFDGFQPVQGSSTAAVTVTCRIHGARPLPGQEENWEHDVGDDQAVLAFRATGAVEDTGVVVGPVYLEKHGEPVDTLDDQATWRPEEGMEWITAFGGPTDTRYKATFSYTDYNGLLYENGQVIHWLKDCRIVEVEAVPLLRPVASDEAPRAR